MKLIVGLGNPGKKYAKTRHNVGFMALDKLAQELEIKNFKSSKSSKAEYTWANVGGQRVELFRPMNSMNLSGVSVAVAKNKHRELELSDIYVIHDDLDLRLGSYKVQKGRGPREHNGVSSVEEKLGKDFWRIRVGVDNRDPKNRTQGEDYVLQNFSDKELMIVSRVIDRIIENLEQNVFN